MPELETQKILDTYIKLTPNSAASYDRARKALPGGNSRQLGWWPPYPICIERGEGPFLHDIDGNRFIDLLYNQTALIHGNAYPPINEAVKVEHGTAWAANNPSVIELAEEISRRVASVDRVRFTNSGTEAGMLALSMARTATGREKILMARAGYHGAITEFKSGALNMPGPYTYVADYNDLASFEAVLNEHGDEIAAVFLEPMMGTGGLFAGTKNFLQGVQKAAKRAGALFVLDEVIGVRMSEGGSQKILGLDPDLTMFGKLIGGGFPVGAVGGKDELMSMMDPETLRELHSGTFSGNAVTMRAGVVAMKHLTEDKIDKMQDQAVRVEASLKAAAKKNGLPLVTRQVGSLLSYDFADAFPSPGVKYDTPLLARFHMALLNQGLFPMARGAMVLCTVMDDALIDEVGERIGAAMADLAAEADELVKPLEAATT